MSSWLAAVSLNFPAADQGALSPDSEGVRDDLVGVPGGGRGPTLFPKIIIINHHLAKKAPAPDGASG